MFGWLGMLIHNLKFGDKCLVWSFEQKCWGLKCLRRNLKDYGDVGLVLLLLWHRKEIWSHPFKNPEFVKRWLLHTILHLYLLQSCVIRAHSQCRLTGTSTNSSVPAMNSISGLSKLFPLSLNLPIYNIWTIPTLQDPWEDYNKIMYINANYLACKNQEAVSRWLFSHKIINYSI